jgi:hypothetical protein
MTMYAAYKFCALAQIHALQLEEESVVAQVASDEYWVVTPELANKLDLTIIS